MTYEHPETDPLCEWKPPSSHGYIVKALTLFVGSVVWNQVWESHQFILSALKTGQVDMNDSLEVRRGYRERRGGECDSGVGLEEI